MQLTNEQIESIFVDAASTYTETYTHLHIQWFDSVLSKLAVFRPLPDSKPKMMIPTDPTAFVDTKVKRVILSNKTLLQFNSMYVHVMIQSVPAAVWNVENFPDLLTRLVEYRKQTTNLEASGMVKSWLNTIYGATNRSSLTATCNIKNLVSYLAYLVMEQVYDIPSIIYIDTDTVVIDDTLENVEPWLRPRIKEITNLPFTLMSTETVSIFRAKAMLFK